MNCPLCNRPLEGYCDEHHLIPKAKKGKETVTMHRICHSKLHSVWTEKELADYYHTFERILTNETIQKFVKWVRKKPNDFYEKTKDSKVRKGKRKR